MLNCTACALGVLEKVVAALYETSMRSIEKVHQPWLLHNENQARSGLEWLARPSTSPWLTGENMTQANITTVVMYESIRIVNAPLIPEGAYPRLDELARRCGVLPAFASTKPSAQVDQTNPELPKSVPPL